MATQHIDTINPMYIITFKTNNKNRRAQLPPVKARLPETFGFSVGSEIGTPFSGYVSDGNFAKVFALYGGVTAKIGVVTTKAYMGPEPTEMSLSLEFDAYYSGAEEVIFPIACLMSMAVGTNYTIEEGVRKVLDYMHWFNVDERLVEGLVKKGGLSNQRAKQAQTITDHIQYMKSPGTATIQFGNIMTLRDCFISTVEPQFTNILDNQGYPMQATASVTIQLRHPVTMPKVGQIFGSRHFEGNDADAFIKHKEGK